MKITWSAAAWDDVGRIYAFLAEYDLNAADRIFDRLVEAPTMLQDFPRRGSRLNRVANIEIREFRLGNYIVRYGLKRDELLILRFVHGREHRSS